MSAPDSMLERAIQLAVKAHAGQVDKAGLPYIMHPLHLMMQMKTEAEMITAVLHDVVEDSDVTFVDLEALGFAEPVLTALRLLTHEEELSYEAYIAAIKPNRLARRVKLADLSHNMDPRRLAHLREKDLVRLQRYHDAFRTLSEP